MKRPISDIQKEAESFTLDELGQMAKIYQAMFLERSALVSEQFFSHGGADLFQGEILPYLSHQLSVEGLLEIRLVSKQWSVLTTIGVSHLIFSMDSPFPVFPFRPFHRITSLEMSPLMMINKRIVLPDITELTITVPETHYGCGDELSLSGWTSLKKLCITLDNNEGVCCVDELTNLTSLTCHAYCFVQNTDVFNLTNLTHLDIYGYPDNLELSTKLPNLTYLSSCSPLHFASYTGEGILDTSYCDESYCVGPYVIKPYYDYYYPDCDEILAKGSWKLGVFTGDGCVRFRSLRVYARRTIEGPMVDGKFHGNIRTECNFSQTGSFGNWSNGQRHGFITLYEWEMFSKDQRRSTKKQEWSHGTFVCSEEVY